MNKIIVKHASKLLLLLFISSFLNSCKKFLDEKPDLTLAVPSTIGDAQALLDDYGVMNANYPGMGARSDDDFFLTDAYLNGIDVNAQGIYTWQKEIVADDAWTPLYRAVLKTNLAMETLDGISITPSNANAYNNAYGSALFFRSLVFYQLLQVYAKPYDSATASKEIGIPLRLHSDVNTENKRNGLAEGYDRIINDAKASVPLLPVKSTIVTRPSKAAAYSLLSNIYLTMSDFQRAGTYADSALQLQSTLMNFSSLDTTAAKPFVKYNEEVIFYATIVGATSLYASNQKVDTMLYASYKVNDLRRPLYFKKITGNQYSFKGNFQGSTFGVLFCGFAVDEMLLVRAECEARQNNVTDAMKDLNTLLVKRFKTNLYVPYTAANAAIALEIILAERRKSLVGRIKRWNDLRRLNKETAYAKTLQRLVKGTSYELLPNDKRYTFYIPQNVVQMTGMQQNER